MEDIIIEEIREDIIIEEIREDFGIIFDVYKGIFFIDGIKNEYKQLHRIKEISYNTLFKIIKDDKFYFISNDNISIIIIDNNDLIMEMEHKYNITKQHIIYSENKTLDIQCRNFYHYEHILKNINKFNDENIEKYVRTLKCPIECANYLNIPPCTIIFDNDNPDNNYIKIYKDQKSKDYYLEKDVLFITNDPDADEYNPHKHYTTFNNHHNYHQQNHDNDDYNNNNNNNNFIFYIIVITILALILFIII